MENSDRFHGRCLTCFGLRRFRLGDDPFEENWQPLSGIPEQSDVYRDSVQTDDLHRAIQYLDKDACGAGSSFIPEERVITGFSAATHEERNHP